jgi:hypothetical protein
MSSSASGGNALPGCSKKGDTLTGEWFGLTHNTFTAAVFCGTVGDG